MQVKRYLYYFTFLILLFEAVACEPKKEVEGRILSQHEMVNTLLDVYITEQKVTVLTLPRDSSELLFKKLNAKVLESRNVPDSVLKKSFDYYLARPKELEKIYTALVDSLNLREQRSASNQPAVQ
jgi:hypothetical protein